MATNNFGIGAGNSVIGQTDTNFYGNTGTEAVTFNAALAAFNTSIDQNIERVNFSALPAAYQFQQAGNTLRVFSGSTLVTTIVIQDDANGTLLTFAGSGDVTAKLDGSVLKLNGATVPTTAGAVVIPGVTPVETGVEHFLTVGVDRFVGTSPDAGTAAADTYIADIVQNNDGAQTNTLGTGDRINGGGGTDSLLAHVQDASPLNAGPSSSINPITTDVEVVHFNAEANYSLEDVDSNSYLGVEINAARMQGLDEIGSVQSDSSLTIYNVTTLTDSGLYADRRVTESITVRFDHTGNDSAVLPEANLTVLFDQDYLLASPPTSANSSLTLQVLDIDNEINTGQPLATNPFDRLFISVTVDGVSTPYTLEFESKSNLTGIAAYQELAASINEALQAEGLDQIVAEVGSAFGVVDPDGDPGGPSSGYNIVITNTGEGTLNSIGFGASGIVPSNTDYQKEVFPTPPDETPEFITSDVVLYKVGKGADGGALTIGGMGTDLDNVLVGRDDVLGVEQFDVTVEGDDTQDSSLSVLQSTTNSLRYVYVESAAGTDADDAADLIIGNSNSFENENGPLFNIGSAGLNPFDVTTVRNNGLKDVVIFDTTGANSQGVGAFLGDVTVHAYFSQELREKYLDQTDTNDDPSADDIDALYTTGVGNDTVNLAVSQLNFTSQGAATRDDFSVSVFTNDGDDHVQFQIGDGEGLDDPADDDNLPQAENWYHNHVLSDNFNVVTGSGNDFVESWGSSAARITLGTGNDIVYTDNSGEVGGIKPDFDFTDDIAVGYHATWVYNAQNDELASLESELPISLTTVGNVRLTVTYLGIETTVAFNNTNGVNGGTVTDLDINQAIKDAINSDGSPFEGLLVAEDGPARTLIVRSLTDGSRYEEDLQIDLFSLPLNAGQIAAGTDAVDTVGGYASILDRYEPDFADYFGNELSGNASTNINNDRVNGGLGDDTIVLSTNEDSVEHVVIDGLFDSDIVLNFEAGVETATATEVQTFTFDGEDDAIGDGDLVLSVFGVEVTVPFTDGTALEDIIDDAVAAIQDAIDDGLIDATVAEAGGVITVSALAGDGEDYPDGGFVIEGGGTPEVQTIDFDGSLSPNQTITVAFGNLPTVSYTAPAVIGAEDVGTLVTDLQADLIAAGVDPSLITIDTAAGTIELTNDVGGDAPPATVTIVTTGTNNLDVTVGEGEDDVDGTDAGFSVSVGGTDGDVAELSGWDIFDLSTVLNVSYGDLNPFNDDVTDTANFGNNVVENFANVIVDDQEAVELAALDLSVRNVLIIDEFTSTDPSAGAATTEAGRIQSVLNATDLAGANTASNSVVITVDEDDDNLGRFYLVVNGNGAKDVSVTYLGSVEFGDHNDGSGPSSLDTIGEWGLLTEINFEPLTNAQLAATTFTV